MRNEKNYGFLTSVYLWNLDRFYKHQHHPNGYSSLRVIYLTYPREELSIHLSLKQIFSDSKGQNLTKNTISKTDQQQTCMQT